MSEHRLELGYSLPHQGADLHRGGLDRELAAGDPRDVEHLRDHPVEPRGLPDDRVQRPLVALRKLVLAHEPPLEQLGVAEQRGQGVAQLVRGHREKAVAGLHRLLGGGPRRLLGAVQAGALQGQGALAPEHEQEGPVLDAERLRRRKAEPQHAGGSPIGAERDRHHTLDAQAARQRGQLGVAVGQRLG